MSEAYFTSIDIIFANQSTKYYGTLVNIIQLNIIVSLVTVFEVVVVNDILNIMYYDTCWLYGSIFLHNSHFYETPNVYHNRDKISETF